MSYFFGFAIATIGLGAIYSLPIYLKLNIVLAREYERATEDFYSAVKPLVSDDETPTEVLKTVGGLNELITQKRSAWFLLSYLADGRWRRISDPERNKVFVEFFHRRPELEKSYRIALKSWFRAVTALSPLAGRAVRIAKGHTD